MALDELLGFRGPLLSLVRNLLWLLAFNTAYLGIFAFAPAKFGGSLYKALSRLLPLLPPAPASIGWAVALRDWLLASAHELDERSRETALIYQPAHVASMGLGYAASFVMIFLLRAGAAVAARRSREDSGGTNREGEDGARVLRRVDAFDREDDEQEPLGERLLDFLGGVGAVAKVATLLFVKMFLLPLLLGIWLDLATLPLFESTWSDRLAYAGADLCGSIVLHWVTGITVMLLVTMSL